MRISIVINGDTRPGIFETDSIKGIQGNGTKSVDYLKEGVDNKLNFFRGYEIESHLYIDVHENLGKDLLWDISQRVDDLILHKHVKHFEGLSVREIGAALGLAEGTVKAHLFRAVHSLRGELSGYDL